MIICRSEGENRFEKIIIKIVIGSKNIRNGDFFHRLNTNFVSNAFSLYSIRIGSLSSLHIKTDLIA